MGLGAAVDGVDPREVSYDVDASGACPIPMRDRGKRKEAEARILRRRLRRGRLTLLGCLDQKWKEQPHRLIKHKPKFTGPRNSLKKDKPIASQAARGRARDALKRGQEPLPEPKNTIRWDYW